MSTAGVVFDFGGVVFRWQPLLLMQQVLPHRATDAAAAQALAALLFQGFAPGSDWARFDLGQLDAAALAERIAQRSGLPAGDVGAVIAAIPAHLEPLAGTVALMQELHQAGRPLFYLSNMPRTYAEHLERSHAFFAWFRSGIFSSRVGLIKPQAEIFALAQQHFGIDPRRSVFIDDHPANIEAARRLGWQAVHFQDAQQCGRELKEAGWL
jgi:putative hydrolase of the HAD superfamily